MSILLYYYYYLVIPAYIIHVYHWQIYKINVSFYLYGMLISM